MARNHISKAEIEQMIRRKAASGDVDKDGRTHINLLEIMKEKDKKMLLKYDQQKIQMCLDCLDAMTIHGVQNAQKITVIANVLMDPIKDAEKGDSDGCSQKE